MDWSNAPSHLGWKYLPDPEGRTNTYLVKRSEHAEPEVFTHGPFGLAAMIAEVQNPGPYVPMPAEIKGEAGRRINMRYPTWRQLNIIRDGGTELTAMSAYIDAVRAASDALETTLPSDFTADTHWPA